MSKFTKAATILAATAGAMLTASALAAPGAASGADAGAQPDEKGSHAIAAANSQFAVDFFRRVAPDAKQNAFVSPHSISAALAMTWAGARGETADQMGKVLHLSGTPEDVAAAYRDLHAALAKSQQRNGAQLAIANSLWLDQGEHIVPDYTALVQNDFAAAITPVDFQAHADDARKKINAWVADQTKDKIKDILHAGDVGPPTRLVLVNAIYFKGAWESPFNESQNVHEAFHLADGTTQPATLMHKVLTRADASYADFPDEAVPFQMVAINYLGGGGAEGEAAGREPVHVAGDFSFVVLLPRAVDGEEALERMVTADKLSGWCGKLSADSVQVYLPKFRMEQRFELGPALEVAGIKDAFDAKLADFSGMTGDRRLFISAAIHQTFIDVDEKGTEAAAATAVVARGSAARPAPAAPPLFRADHPFLFLIRENQTGSILFMGRLARLN